MKLFIIILISIMRITGSESLLSSDFLFIPVMSGNLKAVESECALPPEAQTVT